MRTRSDFTGKASFYTSGIQCVASARPLDLARDIDDFCSSLKTLSTSLRARLEYGDDLLKELESVKGIIDYTIIAEQFETEQNDTAKQYQELQQIKKDVLPKCQEYDNVNEHIDIALALFEELHSQVEALRWAIKEHNIDHSSKGKPQKLSSENDIDSFFSNL